MQFASIFASKPTSHNWREEQLRKKLQWQLFGESSEMLIFNSWDCAMAITDIPLFKLLRKTSQIKSGHGWRNLMAWLMENLSWQVKSHGSTLQLLISFKYLDFLAQTWFQSFPNWRPTRKEYGPCLNWRTISKLNSENVPLTTSPPFGNDWSNK